MAVKTNAIVQGIVTRITHRDIPREGKDTLHFTNVLIVGDNTLADCTLGRGVSEPTYGEFVTAVVEIDVYRDDDQITLIEYIEVVGNKKAS